MEFTAREIKKLGFPENIRTRFTMYGGDNSESTILFRELMDNCLDLVMRDRISINLVSSTTGNFKFVYDNGSGMPIYQDKDYQESRSILIDTLTSTHVGSNFDKKYPSAGINGVGIKLVSGASSRFYCIINPLKQNNDRLPSHIKENLSKSDPFYVIKMEEGYVKWDKVLDKSELLAELSDIDCLDQVNPLLNSELGTLIIFEPDLQILESRTVRYNNSSIRLLKKYFPIDKDFSSVKFNCIIDKEEVAEFDFREYLGNPELFLDSSFDFSFQLKTDELVPVKFLGSFCYDKNSYNSHLTGSSNLLNTPDGIHNRILHKSLGKALRRFNPILNPADCQIGLRGFTLVIGVKCDYDSQTKVRLIKIGDSGFNEGYCVNEFSNYLYDEVIMKNEDYFKSLCKRIIEYKKSLEILSHKDYILSNIEYSNSSSPTRSMGFQSKVIDCSSNNVEERELYIVEGNSAGSNLVTCRDPKKVAVLPLRGVILNSTTVDLTKIVENRELNSIINTLGTGFDRFINMDGRRYSKVIIACDADTAGSWISSLLLGFFGRYLKEWIDGGYLYLLQSPLYKQDGKYIYDSNDLDKSKKFSRFKGLGELSKVDTREVLLKNRRLIQVTSEKLDEAIDIISNNSNSRKRLSEELGILVDEDKMNEILSDSYHGYNGSIESLADEVNYE